MMQSKGPGSLGGANKDRDSKVIKDMAQLKFLREKRVDAVRSLNKVRILLQNAKEKLNRIKSKARKVIKKESKKALKSNANK